MREGGRGVGNEEEGRGSSKGGPWGPEGRGVGSGNEGVGSQREAACD